MCVYVCMQNEFTLSLGNASLVESRVMLFSVLRPEAVLKLLLTFFQVTYWRNKNAPGSCQAAITTALEKFQVCVNCTINIS